MSAYKLGPWRQGRTLVTQQTMLWTATQWLENERIERRMVFANFTFEDQGRGRRRVAICDNEKDAPLVAAAPEMYEALKDLLADTQHISHNCGEEDCPVFRARSVVAKVEGKV